MRLKDFNFSYTNPYDSMIRPINAVLNAYGNGTLTNQSASRIVYNALIYDTLNNTPGALTEFFDPFVSESIGAGAVADLTIRGGKTKDGKTIYYPQDSAMEIIDASLGHLIAQLEPGASRSSRRVWKGVTQDFTDYGTTYDSATELTALMSGLRVEEAKPMDSLPFIVTSYNKDIENIRRKFASNVYRPNISIENRVGYMTEYVRDNYDTQSRMYRVIKDMEAMGADIGDIEDKIDVRLKNKKRVNALLEGEFIVPNLSESTLQSVMDRLYDENPDEAIKVETQFDTAVDFFDDIRNDLEDIELGQSPDIISNTINSTLNPSRAETESVPTTIEPVAPIAPQVTLPSQITGTPVNQQLVVSRQPLGQQYNLLSSLDKLKAFGDDFLA